MSTKRIPSPPDRITAAWIQGTASRRAVVTGPDGRPVWGTPTGPDRDDAVTELRQIATQGGRLRADLLSQEAGLFRGLAEAGSFDAAHLAVMADLCAAAAGNQLDPATVEEWTAIGVERAAPREPPSTSRL